jgi:hypothetical protein
MSLIFENEPEEPWPGEFDTPEEFHKAFDEYSAWFRNKFNKSGKSALLHEETEELSKNHD